MIARRTATGILAAAALLTATLGLAPVHAAGTDEPAPHPAPPVAAPANTKP